MTAEKRVQFICSENFNAPELGNNFGDLISLLDAVLVDGVELPPISLVAHEGNIMEIMFSTEHKLKLFQIIKLSGFIPNEINGSYRIIGVPTTNSIAIEVTQITSTKGSARLSPLGYEKSFSGVHKAVYRNANLEVEHRPFLRVDNSLDPIYPESGAKFAKVGILEACEGIDDIAGVQYPFDAGSPTKNWVGYTSDSNVIVGWAKWYYARKNHAGSGSSDAEAPLMGGRHWMMIGDENAFYLINTFTPVKSNYTAYGFGVYEFDYELDIKPYFLIAQHVGNPVNYSTNFSSYASQGLGLHTPQPSTYPRPESIILAQNPITPINALGYVEPIAYLSGGMNTYNNNFPIQQYTLVSSRYLIGYLPHIHYIHKSLTSADFNSVAFSEEMYVLQKFLQSGSNERLNAFYLGKL